MKKILTVSLYILSVILLVGTYVIHYFTKAKMGMARYMVYFNSKIDDRLGGFGKGKLLFVVMAIVITFITLALVVLTIKNVRGSLLSKLPADIACVINAFSLFYILYFDREKTRDYYLNSLIYLVTGVAIIFALLLNLRRRDEA